MSETTYPARGRARRRLAVLLLGVTIACGEAAAGLPAAGSRDAPPLQEAPAVATAAESSSAGSDHPDPGASEAAPSAFADTGVVVRPWLVISELAADPLLLEDRAGEFVEIVLLSERAVALADLRLRTPAGQSLAFERPDQPWLQPGEVLVATPLGGPAPLARLRGLRLPNRSGRLELTWRDQRVDVVHWLPRWPWPRHRSGRALERVSPRLDGRKGRSWRHARVPLRQVERGSPGQVRWQCSDLRGSTLAARCSPASVSAKRPAKAPPAAPFVDIGAAASHLAPAGGVGAARASPAARSKRRRPTLRRQDRPRRVAGEGVEPST